MGVTRREAVMAAAGAAVGKVPAKGRTKQSRGGGYDVAVIGAGVFGAWIAWHLKKAGKHVVLVDQYGAGHARSSSGGESRVIRISYGGYPLYSKMAEESLRQWSALSARLSQPILHRTGVLWFSPDTDSYMASSLAYLEAHKLAHWKGDVAQLRQAYPQMRFEAGEAGFLERNSGALIAGRGVQAVIADAGLDVLHQRANGVVSATDKSTDVLAQTLVYACGPWLPKIFPDLLQGRITPTRQEVYHFVCPAGDVRFAPPQLPTWADFNNGHLVYGMPDLEGQGFKIAFDAHGEVVDPDTQDRRVSVAGVEAARAYLARRFPDLATAPLVHSRVCQYENSSNGDFLIDRHPEHENIWLVGGGSGHGFKHGPAVGRLVADHILAPGKPIEPRFSLATKQIIQNRTVY